MIGNVNSRLGDAVACSTPERPALESTSYCRRDSIHHCTDISSRKLRKWAAVLSSHSVNTICSDQDEGIFHLSHRRDFRELLPVPGISGDKR